jgi:hypothetical protein
MEVSGVKKAYYFSFTGEYNALIEVQRDDAYIETMISKEKEFWDCIKNFEPPEMCDRDCIEITDPRWNILVDQYRFASKASKDYERNAENAKQELIELSEGKNARGNGLRLTKSFRKGSVDVESLAEFAGVDKDLFRKKPTNYWRIT